MQHGADTPVARRNSQQPGGIMGLLSKIKDTVIGTNAAESPLSASFATRPDTVYAPVSGMLVPFKEINDTVVSAGLLGEGYGILPAGGHVLYAPANGRVAATTVTNHAIGILADGGVEIVMHIGLGTVEMGGKGFRRLVESNDEVRAGQPLIVFDPAAIEAAGHEDVIVVAVSQSDPTLSVEKIGDSGTLLGGRPLVKLGDPILIVRR